MQTKSFTGRRLYGLVFVSREIFRLQITRVYVDTCIRYQTTRCEEISCFKGPTFSDVPG